MKNIKYKIIAIVALATGLFASCKKEADNIFNMFDDITVTYNAKGPLAVTDYKLVNDGDSVYIDFTITSGSKDMYQIWLMESGVSTATRRIPLDATQRRSYSGLIKLKADVRVGPTTYRVMAIDKDGVYLGDGYKKVTYEVAANYSYFPNRNLYTPDTVNKNKKQYLALTTGETFSYNEGAANSAKIDLGSYSNIDILPNSTNPSQPIAVRAFNLYSLSATPLVYTSDDISTWTKRGTLFSPVQASGGTRFIALNTGTKIMTEAKKLTLTQRTLNKLVPAAVTPSGYTLAPGALIFFVTPEGKYGAMYINSLNPDFAGVGPTGAVNGRWVFNIDIKMAN